MTPRSAPRLAVHDRYRPRTPVRFLKEVVAAVLAHVRRPEMEVSLLLTDDAGIAGIHGQFMDDPSSTDVICFPMDGGCDLAVNVQCARRVARDMGHAAKAELALYVVHGVLHACGYDDLSALQRRRMRAAETVVLENLGLQVSAVDAGRDHDMDHCKRWLRR